MVPGLTMLVESVILVEILFIYCIVYTMTPPVQCGTKVYAGGSNGLLNGYIYIVALFYHLILILD